MFRFEFSLGVANMDVSILNDFIKSNDWSLWFGMKSGKKFDSKCKSKLSHVGKHILSEVNLNPIIYQNHRSVNA